MGHKKTRKHPKNKKNVNQMKYGGAEEKEGEGDEKKVEGEGEGEKETETPDAEKMYNIDRKITSAVRAVSSKRELHSLVLMLFLFTADQYIEQEESFSKLGDKLTLINNVYKEHYEQSQRHYEYDIGKALPFIFNNKFENTDGLSNSTIKTLLSPMLYKKEIHKFAYKIAFIISKYHELLNIVFYSKDPKSWFYLDKSKELPVLRDRGTLLDEDIVNDIKIIRETNLLKKIEKPPPGAINTPITTTSTTPTTDVDSSKDPVQDSNTASASAPTVEPSADNPDAGVKKEDDAIKNQHQEASSMNSKYILQKINEKIKKIVEISGNCIQLDTFYETPTLHPYYPIPTKTDWIYGDVDELIRYAMVFTGLFEVVMEKYDQIVAFEKTISIKYPDVLKSKNLREDYMIMRGANYIGNSKLDQKFASVKRGLGTSISATYEGVKYIGRTTGVTSAAKNVVNTTSATLDNSKTVGGSRRRIRHVVNISKRVKHNRKKFIRVNHTIKRGGAFSFSNLGSSIKNAVTNAPSNVVYSAKKITKSGLEQSGIPKIGNRVSTLYTNAPHQKIYFDINHASKYELLLYLEKMFDLYKVNAFNAGEVIEGEELGLSVKLNKFLEDVKMEEMKELEDESKMLIETKQFYVETVDRSRRLMNGMDETITQGRKLASFMMRTKNGQNRIYEASLVMMRDTFKSLRALAGFMNRNGLVGYAIGFLHIVANVSPFLTPAFPPAMLVSWGAAALRNVIIAVASPVLDAPPVILRRKEDIMKAAQSMMRLENSISTGDLTGKVKEENNFLAKMMEYYEDIYNVKTHRDYNFPVLLKGKETPKEITSDVTSKFKDAINKVVDDLKYLHITGRPGESITPEEEKQISRYYLAQYSADNNMSLMLACNQLISVANETSPFKTYMEYRKVRNKEYVLNEIKKLQLLLKIWFLDTIKTPNHLLKMINNQNILLIPKLREFYDKLYRDSRTPRSFIRGSPENLAQNFKELYPEVREKIDEFVKSAGNAEKIRKLRLFKNTDIENKIKEFVASQMTISMKLRNAHIGNNSTTHVVGEQSKPNEYKYEYSDKCDTTTGMYLRTDQKTADICKIQDRMRKRIKQYMTAAASYAVNHKEIKIDFSNQQNVEFLYKLMICMQHFAKRAYIERDGKTVNGITGTPFTELGKTRYIYWYIDKLNNITDFKNKITDELTNYMAARYIKDGYQIKLLKKDSTDKVKVEVTDLQTTIETYKSNIKPPENITGDYDIVGDLEKKLTTETFKLKTMNVYAPKS